MHPPTPLVPHKRKVQGGSSKGSTPCTVEIVKNKQIRIERPHFPFSQRAVEVGSKSRRGCTAFRFSRMWGSTKTFSGEEDSVLKAMKFYSVIYTTLEIPIPLSCF